MWAQQTVVENKPGAGGNIGTEAVARWVHRADGRVPAKTSPEVAAKLHSDTIAVLAEPAIQKRMQDLGSIPVGSTPEELTRYLQAEIAKWGPVIRDANIRLDD